MAGLSLGIAWTIGVAAQPGGDWRQVSETERETMLYRPASFKRDDDMISVGLRIDICNPYVAYAPSRLSRSFGRR